MNVVPLTLTVITIAVCAYSLYENRRRIRRRMRCWSGNHDAGPMYTTTGGRRIQRCIWCDAVAREDDACDSLGMALSTRKTKEK